MDVKERKKKDKMERREVENKEMQYHCDQLVKLANGSDARGQLSFPPTLQNGQRKKLHNIAASLGLKSKSHGKGDNRFLTVFKKNVVPYVPTGDGSINYLRLTNASIDKLLELTNRDPVSDAEKEITIVRRSIDTTTKNNAHLPFMFGDGRSKTKVTVPPMTNGAEKYRATRQSLPIFEYRDGIIDVINRNQVIVISGETGSGKTTQVPQYIMEDFASRGQECRIICTQPRRLAATSIATRVSTERNDTIGRSVGYQIRLDSRISADTNLIFTTSGFLLRCLTGSKQDDVYKSITHLILDEVHEREKVTDFLLIAIRDAIKTNQHLKVILMSATLDSEQFSRYFQNCPVINVPGRMFDVEIMHLGELLMSTGYKTKEMNNYMTDNPLPKILRTSKNTMDTIKEVDKENEKLKISDDDIEFYDECFDECMAEDDDASFEQIFCLITDENMPVDYMHSTKLRTALGIAAEKGFLNVLTKLLGLGAKPTFKDAHGKYALDYAEENEQEECSELLAYYQTIAPITAATTIAENNSVAQAKAWQKFTQLAYQMSYDKRDAIDHELLFHVIHYIHTEKSTDGSILVFLPGYENIMDQKEKIENRFNMQNYRLFVLHSGVNGTSNSEQSRVFDRMPKGIRKIILSTNIAETSLTINDVVYVVDAGKVKQLSYDSISESTCLTSMNISQACAKQRAGRAGRIQCGFCYRLYSLEQYEAMEKYTLPEILRVPLTEICLNTKILAGDLSIEEFLLKALQPPSATNIRQSIELLKKVNALDADENITYLGIHLANMPVDCQFGKMILYGILLHCLDPVVTIVSALSVKDPFMLPLGNEGEKINQIKKEFARNSLSDHQMLLNTFDEWSKKKTRNQLDFCHENYISQGNMQMIQGVRRLIMGHLTMAGFVCEGTARNIRKLNENSSRWDIVRACLTAGMYPNVCRVSPIVGQLISKQDKKLVPHLSSVLRERKGRFQLDRTVKSAGAEWFIHGEKSRISNNSFVRNITIVPSIAIALFTGPIILSDSCLISSGENKTETLSDMDCDDIPRKDDIENADLDDQLFGCGDIENESETIFNIDDWISFIVDDTEAMLLLQLRQKFASIFVKFLLNPIEFQMTNKENVTLKVLLEVLQEEDDIGKYLKEQAAKAANKTEDDIDGESECIGCMTMKSLKSMQKNDRKPIPERPAGPAYTSAAYNQAIEPEGRRNKKKKKKTKSGQKKQQTNEQNRRHRDVPDDQAQCGAQTSTSTESPNSLAQNRQQKLTQGLFNKLDQPFTPSSLQFPPPWLHFQQHDYGMLNMAPSAMNYSIQNRYFILTVKNVGTIYQSVYCKQWQFKTPLNYIRKQARESTPAKIILFFYVPKNNSIFGYGEFQTRGQGGYNINVDNNIKKFRPLLHFNANDDYEMTPEEGNQVLQICLSIANLNRSS